MEHKWKHNRFIGFEFPERYLLRLAENHLIEIKGNPFKGRTKIKISTPYGDCYESVISNGVVIDERNMNTNKSKDLENFFRSYNTKISSLPDNGILKIIGENYGVRTNIIKQTRPTVLQKRFDLNILFKASQRILRMISNYLCVIFRQPRLSDIIDFLIIISIGFSAYYQNFNYVYSGISTTGAAMFIGYYDWLIRKKNPYLFKIIAAFFIGGCLIYSGWIYQ